LCSVLRINFIPQYFDSFLLILDTYDMSTTNLAILGPIFHWLLRHQLKIHKMALTTHVLQSLNDAQPYGMFAEIFVYAISLSQPGW
jgi:hypothetical protein